MAGEQIRNRNGGNTGVTAGQVGVAGYELTGKLVPGKINKQTSELL